MEGKEYLIVKGGRYDRKKVTILVVVDDVVQFFEVVGLSFR